MLLLGIDIGTASAKGALVDASGKTLKTATTFHRTEYPRPGWAEHDPDAVWWSDVVALCSQLLDGEPYKGSDVGSLGVSAIGPCVLPLDESGQPLRQAILYGIDTRASEQIRLLEHVIGRDHIRDLAGMELSSQATGPKIMWIRENEPRVWARTRKISTATSYVVFRLTGEHVIDHHTAAHAIPLYDIESASWTDTYSDLVTDLEYMPRLAWSDEVAGTVTSQAEAETGLRAGTPVAVGSVDAMSEAVGVGAIEEGDLMLMYGSTAFLILTTSEPMAGPGMWLLPGAFRGSRTVAAGMATTGAITEWFRNLTAAENQPIGFSSLFDEAEDVPAGSEGLLVLPYFSGERTPINDPFARGVLAGLSLSHTRGHVFRAILEGIAFGIRHCFESMIESGSEIWRVIGVGGGASHGTLLPRIVSTVTGMTQFLGEWHQGAVLGNAFLAGCADGLLRREDLRDWIVLNRALEPESDTKDLYELHYQRYLELYPATADLVHAGAMDRPVTKRQASTT